MKKILQLFIFLVIVAVVAGCSSSNKDKQEKTTGKELNLLFNFATSTLDPNVDTTYAAVRAGITETLVKMNDKNLKIEPWLAKDWKSEDGKHWVFTINDDMTFQNGKKVDAEAVKRSLERAIKDNEAVKSALKIVSLKAEGHTLTIVTEKPFPEFPSELVHPNTSIIDVDEKDYVNNPIGTGPFKVASFTSGSAIQLTKYADYWDGAAKLDKATFSFNEDANARFLALKAGEADITYRPPVESLEELKAIEGMVVESVPSLRTHQLTMNFQKETLQDLNIRKALDSLLDREEIVGSILEGQAEVAKGPFLSTFSFAADQKEKTYSLKEAKKYLEEAGYQLVKGVMKKDGKALTFKLLTYQARPELPMISQLVQSNAKQIGVNIEIQQVENIDEYMSTNKDWDLATYSSLTAPRGDAGYFLNATYSPTGALNYGSVNNKELIAKLETLNQTVDAEQRDELAKDMTTIIDQEYLHSFIVHPNAIVAYNGKKVQNWVTTKSEYYMLTNKLDVK
ncbi:nickel ABC transporter substrate-binding protein [Niallia sp. NCCP-28]|uniref:nickel ABC transporter substrate-binding protein n=1 Tax=Niallia sp. NCCP-28 TaxID=2934712 RepID=UPI002082409B|nr:nickel ABC transporter substrate-binding protein [Niallia sp. NCCP-28]GKU80670.1 nickel ABC transporter substrate-binding protein [Niallia sp. NCCP-28]